MDKILQVAKVLFCEHGFDGTSVRDITSSLNITPGALYAHFKSKQELLFALLSNIWDDFIDCIQEAINNHRYDSVESQLYNVYAFYVNYDRQAHCNSKLLLRNFMFPPYNLKEKINHISTEKYSQVIEKVKPILITGIKQDILKDYDLDKHIDLFNTLIKSLAIDIISSNGTQSLEYFNKYWNPYWKEVTKNY
ncbi:TetR/AcrR family transcriptional regulator [Clostridium sp. 'White wine YQ']|uniref:TetR/AcrR family transcriptional regulator n=1 Tax=Clostridium sp. 'White wine YQ' TaxID=3027474 RepID=UPI00236588D5|nr:TetR/AcrR family transcriptional regulator [Clostridium sp. 'White wine YQ']MDD7795695.1 TetR/AcrR family transcriptional regulator [Clostridium sp. 'White wine YQ']